jgi:hypothetical protein
LFKDDAVGLISIFCIPHSMGVKVIKVSEGKYALSAGRGVLGLGGILVVYERPPPQTQNARRTHRVLFSQKGY